MTLQVCFSTNCSEIKQNDCTKLLYIEHRQDGLMMRMMTTIRPREANNYSL